MCDMNGDAELLNAGPPASNLRKSMARKSSAETSMADMSDKEEFQDVMRTVKRKNRTKSAKSEGKPSVKMWLNCNSNEESANGGVSGYENSGLDLEV